MQGVELRGSGETHVLRFGGICLPFILAAHSFIVLCLENSLISTVSEKRAYLLPHTTQGG